VTGNRRDAVQDLPFDRTRAPFQVQDGATPAETAQQIVACFDIAVALPQRVTRCFQAAMDAAGIEHDDVLFRAGEAIARDIDAGIGDGAGNPYHNSRHFCEVLLSALYLSLLAPLQQPGQAQLLVAALAHDFHHDGTSVRGTPFRLERVAVDATLPYLQAAAVPQDACQRIAIMILATEVSAGVPYARRCYRHLFDGAEKPAAPEMEPRIVALAADPALALQALLLTEADVLPSVGLTVAYGELSQVHLSREWGRELGPADKLFFLEHVFGDFIASRFFSPNVELLKQAMREKSGPHD
jgi:hypothetical protein